jgi:hypothetical protein
MRAFLKERLFRKHYDKLLNTRRKISGSTTINTISSITILTAARHHDWGSIKSAYRYFSNLKLSCDIYVVRDAGDNIEVDSIPNLHLIDAKDCMWYDVPNQEILIDWLANKTDLLILSDPDQMPLMKYLCAASNSKLKSTIKHSDQVDDDIDIDLWIDMSHSEDKSIITQCRTTYEMLTNIGIRPPVLR